MSLQAASADFLRRSPGSRAQLVLVPGDGLYVWLFARVEKKKTVITAARRPRKVSVGLHDLEAIQDPRLDVDLLRARRDLPEVHPWRRIRRRGELRLLRLQILLRLSD